MPFPRGAVHAPLVPFTPDGELALDRFTRLVRFHLGAHARGIFVVSHDAELHALRPRERRDLAAAAAAEIGGAVPLWVHVSAPATAQAVELARHAESVQAAGVVLTVPYYWRLSAAAVEEHFLAVGRSVTTPLVLYNSPVHQRGEDVPVRTIERLVQELPMFAGVLDAGHGYAYAAGLSGLSPALALEGEYMLPAFLIGARAAVSPLAAFAPNLVRDLAEAAGRHDVDAATAAQDRAALLLALVRPNPAGRLKAAAALFGRDLGTPRPPVPAVDRAEMERALGAMGLFESEPHGW